MPCARAFVDNGFYFTVACFSLLTKFSYIHSELHVVDYVNTTKLCLIASPCIKVFFGPDQTVLAFFMSGCGCQLGQVVAPTVEQ